MLFGFQPFAAKDPRIFDTAEEFVPYRFVGKEEENLLRHVLWCNGPETESPTVVELFRRYDSFRFLSSLR